MEPILDEIERVNTKETLTKLSIVSTLIAFACFGYMMNIMSITIKAKESLEAPPILIIRLAQVFTIIGTIASIMKYVKKEPSTWKKWFATIIHILLFLLVFGSIGFYYFLEISR